MDMDLKESNVIKIFSYLLIPVIIIIVIYINNSFFDAYSNSKYNISNKSHNTIFKYITLVILLLCSFNLYFIIYDLSIYTRLFLGLMISGVVLISYWIQHFFKENKKTMTSIVPTTTTSLKPIVMPPISKPSPDYLDSELVFSTKLNVDRMSHDLNPHYVDYTFSDIYCNKSDYPDTLNIKVNNISDSMENLRLLKSTKQAIDKCQILI